jgi:multidrug efflux pump subunit AcrB
MWFTRLALRYPVSTFLIAVTITVLGFVSLAQLPIDLLPSISIPTVSVSTNYPGASPLDMEQTVTVPIERAVSSVNNVDHVQSSTREGSSRVQVYFNWGANTDVAMVDIIQRVNRATRNMPDGVQQPTVQRFDVTSRPVCNIVVFGDMDQRDLYDLAANVIEPQIEHLPGVAQAPVSGGLIREIHVTLDRNRLIALKVPVQSVLTAIANSNLTLPSGDLKSGPFDFALKTESRFNVVRPMQDIVVKSVDGVPIPISAIGTVEDSYKEQTEIVRINCATFDILGPVALHQADNLGPRARGPARRASGDARYHRVHPQLPGHDHHHGRDTALDTRHVHLLSIRERDAEHHDLRRPGARGRAARGRFHRCA